MILTTEMKKCAFSIDKEETAGYNNTIENIITLIWKYEQEDRILKVYRQEKMNKDLPGDHFIKSRTVCSLSGRNCTDDFRRQ